MEMRNKYKEGFLKKHGLKLGFMSAFVKASAYALQDQPVCNAVIDDLEVLYRDYVDISVAVSTPKVSVEQVGGDGTVSKFNTNHFILKVRQWNIELSGKWI